MRRRVHTETETSDIFALSIGDLMASLLLIFALFLISSLLQLKLQERKVQVIAEEYIDQQRLIALELNKEFKFDLDRWGATLDSQKLIIRFKEPDILFEVGKSELRPGFEEILSDFFPRYIKVLSKKEFRPYIEEIRIEGHTDSDGDYWFNMELSQDRTRSTARYCLGLMSDPEVEQWVKGLLTANGMSFSRPIKDSLNQENKAASRRVEFRVKSSADDQIRKMLDMWRNE